MPFDFKKGYRVTLTTLPIYTGARNRSDCFWMCHQARTTIAVQAAQSGVTRNEDGGALSKQAISVLYAVADTN